MCHQTQFLWIAGEALAYQYLVLLVQKYLMG